MKKRASTIFSTANFLLLLGASAASAGSIELRADIPFDFMAGNKMLTAGAYRVSRPVNGALQIRNHKRDHGVATVLVNAMESAKAQSSTRLIFNRYGDRYFLSQVWTAGSATGDAIPKSNQERELARELAASRGLGPEIVSIVATLE